MPSFHAQSAEQVHAGGSFLRTRRSAGWNPCPEPQPGPGEVKLRVLYNGICGSDLLEYYDGPVTTRSSTPHPLTGITNPVILGHELCGEVVALGAGRRRI